MDLQTPQAKARVANKANEFFKRMQELYKNKYDFSESVYTGCNKVLTYICPVHGKVTANPDTLYKGKGCKHCNKELRDFNQTRTKDEFIKLAATKFENKYDYSQAQYINNRTKVTIICPIHGKFEQRPEDHLSTLTGCATCGSKQSHKSQTLSEKEVIERFKEYHNENFNYNKFKYVTMHTRAIVTCNRCNSDITVTPNNHLKRDCPNCSYYGGFDQTKPGILYYLSINNGEAFKIGITNRTVKERFKSDMQYITILKEWNFSIGRQAYDKEQQILKEFKQFKYEGPDLLKSGNTELFSIDVLNSTTDISMS